VSHTVFERSNARSPRYERSGTARTRAGARRSGGWRIVTATGPPSRCLSLGTGYLRYSTIEKID
jgi:hypothetical protein